MFVKEWYEVEGEGDDASYLRTWLGRRVSRQAKRQRLAKSLNSVKIVQIPKNARRIGNANDDDDGNRADSKKAEEAADGKTGCPLRCDECRNAATTTKNPVPSDKPKWSAALEPPLEPPLQLPSRMATGLYCLPYPRSDHGVI